MSIAFAGKVRQFAWLAIGRLSLPQNIPHAPAALCYDLQMLSNDLITVDGETLGGTPVFRGTRVPVKSLFEYLEDDYTLNEFLECFPTVTREMAHRVLECSEAALLASSAA